MSEPLNQRRARAAWRGQREAPGQPKAGRVREIRGPSTALLSLSLCLAGGCQGSAGTPSPPPAQASTTLLAWAVALDHGSPWEVSLVEAAVAEGFGRWELEGSSLRVHGQGVGDVPTLEDDGLQVVWLWWESTPWPWDPGSWLVIQRYERHGEAGFDVALRSTTCPGPGDDPQRAFDGIANSVARGVGQGLGVVPSADPASPLSQDDCGLDGPRLPSAEEAAVLRAMYPAGARARRGR